MCPMCVTTAVLIAAGAFSSGGLAALAMRSSVRRIANEADLDRSMGASPRSVCLAEDEDHSVNPARRRPSTTNSSSAGLL